MSKNDHKKVILSYLFPGKHCTRTEIAESLYIRKSTIGLLCSELLKQHILMCEEGVKRNARLWINPSAFLCIGIQHKVDCLKIVLMDAELKVCEKLSVPLEDVFEELRVEKIIQIINEFIQQKNINRKLIVGIGFSDFIPHDIGTGLKTKSIWMPGWGDINIKAMIEENLKLNTHIMRCTDAFSFAEYAFGSCKGCNAFITAQLEEGIGLSVFKNCNFLKGSTDIFGELGHIVYREDGEICRCGNRGCLETIAGIEAIIKKVQENVEKGAYFKTDRGTEKITFDDIVINALEGNKLALLSINEAAKAIGNTLAVVVNVLGITRIILYGRFIKAGKLISQQVLNSIRQHCIYPLNQDTEVILSSLDEYGSAKGAAYAVLRKYLQNYEIGI